MSITLKSSSNRSGVISECWVENSEERTGDSNLSDEATGSVLIGDKSVTGEGRRELSEDDNSVTGERSVDVTGERSVDSNWLVSRQLRET